MFDFVTVLGSITDILVTEIKVRPAAIMGPSECHDNSLLYVSCTLVSGFTVCAHLPRLHCREAACYDTGSRFTPVRGTVMMEKQFVNLRVNKSRL